MIRMGMHTVGEEDMLLLEAELEADRPDIAWRRPVGLDGGFGCRFCAHQLGDWHVVARSPEEFEEHMMMVHGRPVL